MSHFALMWGFIGRIHAIRAALDYDLTDLPFADCMLTGAAARLWRTNFAAWRVTR